MEEKITTPEPEEQEPSDTSPAKPFRKLKYHRKLIVALLLTFVIGGIIIIGNRQVTNDTQATVYCRQHGGKAERTTDKNGLPNEYCVFSDGRKCDSLDFFWNKTCSSPTPTVTPTNVPDEIIPSGYRIPCEECNFTKDGYIQDYPKDTSNWNSYTIPEEKLTFKYPSDWKIDRSQSSTDSFTYTIKSPHNFVISIGDYYGLGGGCGGRTCREFNVWNIVLGQLSFYNQPLYIVVNGIRKDGQAGSKTIKFNVLTTNNCFDNICYGFRGSKGETIIYGGFEDQNSEGERFTYMDPDTFINSPDVKTAVGVLKTLHY